MRGVAKAAKDVVINVLLSLNFAPSCIKSISFPLATADWTGNGLLNRQYAANISIAFITYQCIGAANYLAQIYWCCQHKKNPQNRIIGAASLLFITCIAPVVWSFLSTTAQPHATHRKGGRRGKRHSSSTREWGHSCIAWGYCVS